MKLDNDSCKLSANRRPWVFGMAVFLLVGISVAEARANNGRLRFENQSGRKLPGAFIYDPLERCSITKRASCHLTGENGVGDTAVFSLPGDAMSSFTLECCVLPANANRGGTWPWSMTLRCKRSRSCWINSRRKRTVVSVYTANHTVQIWDVQGQTVHEIGNDRLKWSGSRDRVDLYRSADVSP